MRVSIVLLLNSLARHVLIEEVGHAVSDCSNSMAAAVERCGIKTILSSRRFLSKAGIEALEGTLYIEDVMTEFFGQFFPGPRPPRNGGCKDDKRERPPRRREEWDRRRK